MIEIWIAIILLALMEIATISDLAKYSNRLSHIPNLTKRTIRIIKEVLERYGYEA